MAGFQYTLDVVGYEVQSTVLTFFGELGKTLAVVIGMCWHSRFPDMTLVDLGYLYLILELIYFAAVMITIYSYGWLEKYYEGFFSICKKNTDESNTSQSSVNSSSNVNMVAIKFMLYNAMISSLSNLLMQGEWQVMIFYARYVVYLINDHKKIIFTHSVTSDACNMDTLLSSDSFLFLFVSLIFLFRFLLTMSM